MFEPFYIDTQAFLSMAGSNAGLPGTLTQLQSSLTSLAAVNPSYAMSTVPDAGCQALVAQINSYVTQIIAMHAKAQQSAAQLGQVSASLQKTLSYLNETASDMEQVENSVRQMADNWSGKWMNGINNGG